MEKLLAILGQELVNSPFLSVMILDNENNIVWHNPRFAQDFNQGENLVGKKCFNVTGSDAKHNNCPLDICITENKRVKGYLDFGSHNFFYLTVPLDEKHSAKVHVFLPKEPDNKTEKI
jgi:transcriptional regulator with PAS, ATPase and Fis domain